MLIRILSFGPTTFASTNSSNVSAPTIPILRRDSHIRLPSQLESLPTVQTHSRSSSLPTPLIGSLP